MKSRSLLVCLLLVMPAAAPGANKEILELQRDIAQLQQLVKDLQGSQNEKFSALTEIARQSVQAATSANTSVAVITANIEKNLRDQTDKVSTPVQGLSTRLNEMGGELRTVTQAVQDLTQLMARLQAQLTDINTSIKVMQAPPAPPPAQPGAAPTNEAPPMPATRMYDAALGDYRSGKYDLAVQEFSDYLKFYGNTDLAPNAQFYIAMIHFVQGTYESAVKEFDMVLEKYPDNNKTPDALLYKGRSLVKMPGHKTEGANEFSEVIQRFPKSDQAVQACTERKALGLNCPVPSSVSRSTAPGKKKK